MKRLTLVFSLLAFAMLVGLVNPLRAENDLRRRDYQAILEFLNSKRTIPLSEKDKTLRISGDIRAVYLDRCETGYDIPLNAVVALRGHGAKDKAGVRIPHVTYESVLTVRFDYKCGKKSWAAGHFALDNPMGITCGDRSCKTDKQAASGSGACNDLCLKRCYGGINLYDCEGIKLDVEIGRRPMYTLFDSRIEFHSRFDGLLFKLSDFIKGWGNYYAYGGPFITDYRVNHFNGVVEVGIIDFYEVGVDIKYSFIDWRGENRCRTPNPLGFRFQNSQWAFAYNFSKELIPRKMKLYYAFLVNHAALVAPETNTKENRGWYAGFIVGEVIKKGDWSLDCNYQDVQAHAISDCDIHGIGRGNLRKESFTQVVVRTGRRGKGNYKGWHIEGLYAVTDKLSLDLLFEHSKAQNWRIGGPHTFTKTEFDIIMAY